MAKGNLEVCRGWGSDGQRLPVTSSLSGGGGGPCLPLAADGVVSFVSRSAIAEVWRRGRGCRQIAIM